MGPQADNPQGDAAETQVQTELRSRLTREMRRSAEYESQLTQAQIEVEGLRAHNNALSRELHQLKDENSVISGELHAARNENEQILNSTSWRITKPIRKIRGGSS